MPSEQDMERDECLSSIDFEIRSLKALRDSAQRAKRGAESTADKMEDEEYVPGDMTRFFRGRESAFEQMVSIMDEQLDDLRGQREMMNDA